MIVCSLLLLLLLGASLVASQHIVTSNPPNFSLYVFRLTQSGLTNNGFNVTAATNTPFNGQVAVSLVVNGVIVEQLAPLSAGADSVSVYVQRSIVDAGGNQPASVVLRFNTSNVQTPIGDCNLVPFSVSATRTTCTLVQTVQFLGNPTPVCAFIGGTCAAPLQTNANSVNLFGVVTSTEELDARVCATSQLFVRGVAPTCPNRIRRTTSPVGVLIGESVVLSSVILPTPFTVPGKVPSTQLARANEYQFDNPTSAPLSGPSRSYEAIVPTSGPIGVTARTTGFVKLLNAAHREFAAFGIVQSESQLTFVVRDVANNNIVHLETLATAQQSAFIELPTGQYKFNTFSGRNLRSAITIPGQNITGTVSADLVFAVDENKYNLVAATTSTIDATFSTDALLRFDVTPATNTVAGTTEQQVINLLVAPPPLAQDVKLLRTVNSNADSLQCTSFGAVGNGQSLTLPAQSAALPIEFALGGAAVGCATCSRVLYAAPATLGVGSGACGKRITVLIGRAYQLDTQTFVNGVCSVNTTTVEIGDLAFIGTRLVNRQQSLQPVTFEIQNCACVAPAVTCTETLEFCDSQRIVTLGSLVNTLTSSVGSVSSAVGGVSSALGGVSAAIGVVQSGVRQVNTTVVGTRTTLNNVAADVNDILDAIEKKNKGLQDTLEDVKSNVEDIKSDVEDVKDDIEQKNKGLLDRVKDLSDECNQVCDDSQNK